MTQTFRAGWLVAGLALMVMVAGLIYSLRLGNELRFGDEFGYTHVAHNLVTRHWYSEDGIQTSAYRAPGYPWLLGLGMLVGANIVALRVVNFVALAAAMLLAYTLLARQSSPRAGLLAAVGLLCYPVLFFTAGTLYPQTVGAALLLGSLTVAARAEGYGGRWALAGAIFGLAVLAIPSFLLMLPVFALLPVFLSCARRWPAAALYLVGTLAVIAPWTARNYTVFHRFVPVSTNSGINLLLGNCDGAGPNTGYTVNIDRYSRQTTGMDEAARDDFFRRAALRWIGEHPARVASLYVLKTINFFNVHNELDTHGESSRAKDLVMLLTYGPLLVLLLLRLASWKRVPTTPLERFLLVAYLANALLSAVFFTRIRFRLPFDILLICALALFVDQALRPVLRRPAPPPETAQRA